MFFRFSFRCGQVPSLNHVENSAILHIYFLRSLGDWKCWRSARWGRRTGRCSGGWRPGWRRGWTGGSSTCPPPRLCCSTARSRTSTGWSSRSRWKPATGRECLNFHINTFWKQLQQLSFSKLFEIRRESCLPLWNFLFSYATFCQEKFSKIIHVKIEKFCFFCFVAGTLQIGLRNIWREIFFSRVHISVWDV